MTQTNILSIRQFKIKYWISKNYYLLRMNDESIGNYNSLHFLPMTACLKCSIIIFLKILLNNLYTKRGAQTYNLEIKSHTLLRHPYNNFFLSLFTYFESVCMHKCEHEWGKGRGKEKGRERKRKRTPSRLHTVSKEPKVELKLPSL